MNLYIFGTQECKVIETGEPFTRHSQFKTMQTPTEVTRKLLASEDVAQAYIDWVLSRGKDEQLPVYAENDYFRDGEPIGYKTVNWGKEHVADFKRWLTWMEEQGWDVHFEEL